MASNPASLIKRVGRYELYNELAHGGTASVHLGKLVGPVGFARTVAIKRLHPHLLKDVDFREMFIDEARLAARIRHPNVVSIIDVIHLDGELFLVMDLVQGVSLHRLMQQARQSGSDIPVDVAAGVMVGALQGLHSAHEVKGDHGERLNIVHRDVSPHNIMVATDGVPRVLDFGIAKASGKLHNTSTGVVKGKFAYMPPEQIAGDGVGASADIYAAGVVLWELLTGRRLFQTSSEAQLIALVLQGSRESPQKYRPQIPEALAAAVMKAISPLPEQRFASAREFASELDKAVPVASPTQIGRWVEVLAAEALDETALMVAGVESQPSLRSYEERRASDRAGPMSTSPPARPDPSSSQVSSVVVSQLTGAPTASARWPLVAVAVAAIAAVLAFALLRPLGGSSREQPGNVATGQSATETPVRPPTLTSSSTAAADAAAAAAPTLAPTTDVAASGGASSADVPDVTEPHPAKRPAVRPRVSPAGPRPATAVPPNTNTPPPRAAADCDPPYTRDSRGIQRIKPQCM